MYIYIYSLYIDIWYIYIYYHVIPLSMEYSSVYCVLQQSSLALFSTVPGTASFRDLGGQSCAARVAFNTSLYTWQNISKPWVSLRHRAIIFLFETRFWVCGQNKMGHDLRIWSVAHRKWICTYGCPYSNVVPLVSTQRSMLGGVVRFDPWLTDR